MKTKINMRMNICRTGVILAGIMFILNSFDCLATLRLSYYEGFYELNPLMRFLLDKIGEWMIFPKIACGFFVSTMIAIWWTMQQNVRTLDMNIIRLLIIGIISIYGVLDVYHGFLILKGG